MRTAFGLTLKIDPSIEIPGIANGEAPGPVPQPLTLGSSSQPMTQVRLAPEELGRRWRSAARNCERMRELHAGENLLLSVDLEPATGYLLHAPGFARVLVTPGGEELLCEPERENTNWAALLSAQALPLAATLQGLEILHASAVVPADGALAGQAALFTGAQGAGKSSLAAALLRRGAAMLSDDAVALQACGESLTAHQGTGVMYLRAQEYERLSPEQQMLHGTPAAVLGKLRCTPSTHATAATLGALFLLERSLHGPPVDLVEAVDPFALLGSTFNVSVRTPERLTRHLDLAASLARTGRVYRLRIQPGIDATQLADMLEERLLET